MAHVDALNIRRDTPLHIACEYGSSQLATRLLTLGADMLATNVDGYNCLEVAIEHNNEEVVKFLIENENAFDLMRNAQVKEKKSGLLHRFVTHYKADTPMRNAQVKEKKSWLLHQFVTHYEADTPMRKLIRKMPKMALRMLDKCTMTVGTDGTDVHKQVYIYEFLDDQYTIKDWQEGK
jgi:predicted PolB exonuclease-like 3'-5' exonuclease